MLRRVWGSMVRGVVRPRVAGTAMLLPRALASDAAIDTVQSRRHRKRLSTQDKAIVIRERDYLENVIATCTAEGYDIRRMMVTMQPIFPGTYQILEDVIYVKIPKGRDAAESNVEAYVFADGCFVMWGPQRDISTVYSTFKEQLRDFETNRYKENETETMRCDLKVSDQFEASIRSEVIVLEYNGTPEEYKNRVIPAKVAFSNGLANSVKLAALEEALNHHIERVKPIPSDIAAGRSLPLGRSEVFRLIGELLKFRADLNLHSELIDTPEMYWSELELEEMYIQISKVLEIRQRVTVLNKKLDYANELASVLRSHLSEQHNLNLEWGIIILIAVEVAFETLHWIY
jgi:uncharacterized Rmd1/YagE family protein